jgi:hypothetical protein
LPVARITASPCSISDSSVSTAMLPLRTCASTARLHKCRNFPGPLRNASSNTDRMYSPYKLRGANEQVAYSHPNSTAGSSRVTSAPRCSNCAAATTPLAPPPVMIAPATLSCFPEL